jgi:hypothetical protein
MTWLAGNRTQYARTSLILCASSSTGTNPGGGGQRRRPWLEAGARRRDCKQEAPAAGALLLPPTPAWLSARLPESCRPGSPTAAAMLSTAPTMARPHPPPARMPAVAAPSSSRYVPLYSDAIAWPPRGTSPQPRHSGRPCYSILHRLHLEFCMCPPGFCASILV